jgi:uncharacterized membrane-anchored protein YitT (DUF2179 family)
MLNNYASLKYFTYIYRKDITMKRYALKSKDEEIIAYVIADDLNEAIIMFSLIKKISVDDLLKIFDVVRDKS